MATLKDELRVWLTRVGRRQRHVLLHETALAELTQILDRADAFDATYQGWADEESRAWMLTLLSYRVLGRGLVRLPRDTPAFWQAFASSQQAPLLREHHTTDAPGLGALHRYAVTTAGVHLTLQAHPLNILATFLLEQYGFGRNGVTIRPATSDVVLDCGGCWGDTALWMAAQIGPSGAVHSFEFVPANLRIFEQNLIANPTVAHQVRVRAQAVSHRSGEHVNVAACGPATSLRRPAAAGALTAETIALDDYVLAEAISRVGFIKMDIEGAELAALTGAEETIRRDRPACAIALYHRLDDWTDIPAFFRNVGGYQLYVDHFSTHGEETVLFAKPSAG